MKIKNKYLPILLLITLGTSNAMRRDNQLAHNDSNLAQYRGPGVNPDVAAPRDEPLRPPVREEQAPQVQQSAPLTLSGNPAPLNLNQNNR